MIFNSSGIFAEAESPFTFQVSGIKFNDIRLIICEPIQLKENLQESTLLCDILNML